MKKLIVTFLLIYFSAFIFFDYKINNYHLDTTTKTDAIVVVTGGKNRIEEGVLLLQNNLAPTMFISGVSKKASAKSLHLDNYSNIELGYKATTTLENGLEIKEWLKDKNIKTIRLVTSNYHLPRASLEIKNKNNSIKIIENPIYSDNISHKWWQSFDTFSFIFIEFNKALFVLLRNLI